jgi:hypothetical protein
MTTIMVDDEPETRAPPPPDFIPPSIRERLAEGFDTEAEFSVVEGQPYVLWANWDHAQDWRAYPIREVRPYHPAFHGKQISESEFRAIVANVPDRAEPTIEHD